MIPATQLGQERSSFVIDGKPQPDRNRPTAFAIVIVRVVEIVRQGMDGTGS